MAKRMRTYIREYTHKEGKRKKKGVGELFTHVQTWISARSREKVERHQKCASMEDEKNYEGFY